MKLLSSQKGAVAFFLAAPLLFLSCGQLAKKSDENSGAMALALATSDLSSSTTSSSCISGSGATTTATLNFRVMANGATISCGTGLAVGAKIGEYTDDGTTHTIVLQDMRFYISNIKLIDENNNCVNVNLATTNSYQDATTGVAILDFEDKTGNCIGTTQNNTSVQISYPAGNYKGVQFDVGIPDRYNRLYYGASPASGTPTVLDTTANAPSGMYWSWASAYKFTKIEFKDTVTNNVAVLHLGSSGTPVTNYACDDSTLTAAISPTANNINPGVASACKYENRPTVKLTTTSFDPATTTKKVALDAQSLFATTGSNTVWAAGAMGSCMSGRTAGVLKTPCVDPFTNIGVSPTTGGSTGLQTAFSLQ